MDTSALLWYKTPADDWDKALPLGNGRIGAMVFSQPLEERIQLKRTPSGRAASVKEIISPHCLISKK